MKILDITSLSPDEYKMYSESKLRFQRAAQDLHDLADLPPFAFDKNGNRTELLSEFLYDIRQETNEIDEEDFITDRYKPFPKTREKYQKEINEARAIRAGAPSLGMAVKKWFDDNGLKMTAATAYSYGVEQ